MKTRFAPLWLLLVSGCAAPELTFTDLRVTELTSTRARIEFETDRPASCEIELGTSPDLLDQHFTDPDMAPGQLSRTHSVPVENLSASTRFHLRAKAQDSAGNVFRSALTSFETPAGQQAPGRNVALAAEGTSITAASSNFGGGGIDSFFGALKAIDGDFATEWSSSGDGTAAQLTLDLGQRRLLTHFGFRSRSMSDGTAIITRVSLSLDGASPLVFDTPDPNELYVFPLLAPTEARTARVAAVASTGGNTGAKEIQLLVGL